MLSKLFKKKSKANLSSTSVNSVHSHDSKNSGVTINYHDHIDDSNEQRSLKKKTSGLFKKRSKTKLVEHNKNSRARSSSLSRQDPLVTSSLRKNSVEVILPQSSTKGDAVAAEEETEVPLLHELDPQRFKLDKDLEESGDALASFTDGDDVPVRVNMGQEPMDVDDDHKLTNLDVNNLDSSDNASEVGLKSKKLTVKKHKRYRHRKKEKELDSIKTGGDANEVTAVKDQSQTPSQGNEPLKTIDQDTKENGTTATANDEALTKEQQQLQKIDIQEKLKKSIKRTSKANQPIEFTDSAFGFPLPPPSQSTIVMLDYRFPVHVERAIYRLSHLKLANPKRSLREQVLLSNFMYAYLNLVDHTLHMEQLMGGGAEDEVEQEEQERGGGARGAGENGENDDGDDEEGDETMVDLEGEDADAEEDADEEEVNVLDDFGTDGGVDDDFGEDIVDGDVVVGFSTRTHRSSGDDDDDDDEVEEELLPNEERIRITV